MVGIGALVVSVCAVAIGGYEAYLQRKYDRASVWPRLELTTSIGPDAVKLELVNSGLGPALVEYAAVSVDGKPTRDWADALERVLGRAPASYSSGSVRDRAIRAGESAMMLAVPASEVQRVAPDRLDHVALTICYASVYQEHWELIERGAGPHSPPSIWRSVDTCPTVAPNGF